MTISLKDVEKKVTLIETFITENDVKEYIANHGTVEDTKRLGDIDASHYRCNSSCSWTCSGGTKDVDNVENYKGK